MRSHVQRALLAALLTCGAALAQAEVEVHVPAGQVLRFAETFALEVRRTAPSGCTYEAFDAAALQPLALELREARMQATTLRDGASGHVELRRYAARAFVTGELSLPALACQLQQPGGAVLVVRSRPTTLQIASQLGEPPGDFEWPGDVRELPRRAVWLWLLVATGALLGAVMWWHRRNVSRRAAGEILPNTVAAAATAVPWHELLLQQLRALGADLDHDTFHGELVRVLREFLHRRYDLRAEVRTSEELWQHQSVAAPQLRDCLSRCDLVKFACWSPTAAEREQARAAAIAFVAACAPPAAEGER